jgi:hypothetical protein
MTTKPLVKGGSNGYNNKHKKDIRGGLMTQFNYMRSPGVEHNFDVGDTVEVFCDHERSGERVRGWLKGIVVQLDNKLVAVQFRSNVFLTDGWMVPDKILWFSINSEHIRPSSSRKNSSSKKKLEY